MHGSTEPLSRFKTGGAGGITAAFSGLSLGVSASRASPGLASVSWPTFEPPTRVSLGSTGGRPKEDSRSRPLARWLEGGVLSGRLHEGFPTRPALSGLARLQHGGVRVHKPGQVGTVE